MTNHPKFTESHDSAARDVGKEIALENRKDKMKAQLIVEITPDGIVVTGCENIPVPNYSVEEQAMNPLLGPGYAGRSIDEAFRFITQIAEKVCHA